MDAMYEINGVGLLEKYIMGRVNSSGSCPALGFTITTQVPIHHYQFPTCVIMHRRLDDMGNLESRKNRDIAHVIQLVNWNYIYTYRKPYVHR